MKRFLSVLIILQSSFIILFAQVPQGFNYQAVVRDDAGDLIKSQNVSLQVSILAGAADGTLVFRENHFPTTNDFGLVTLKIGSGTNVTGSITSIDWESNTYFLQVALDPSGGTSFTPMGTTQILSVPYAIYSETAENFSGIISESQISDLGDYIETETDPVFGAHESSGISSSDIANWNSAYEWGDHSTSGYLEFVADITSTSYQLQAIYPTLLFKGRLHTSANEPLEGVLTMGVSLYDSEQAGMELWNEYHDVSLMNGYFGMQLGTMTPFPTDLFATSPLYLEFTIGGQVFSGRIRLSEVSRAHVADRIVEMGEGSNLDADLLDGFSSNHFLTVNYEETDPAVTENFDFTGAIIDDLLMFDGSKWVRAHPAYAPDGHTHSATDITTGTLPVDYGGTGSSTIGSAGRVAYSNGSTYAFTGPGTVGHVLVSGGTGAPIWTSSPTVTQINYSSPRTHYVIVGESSFHPRNGDELVEFGWGNSGAWLTGTTAPGGGLYAELDVPVGAKITQIDIGYYDADPDNKLNFMVNGQFILGTLGYTGTIGSAETSTSAGSGYVSISGLNYTVNSDERLRLLVVAKTNDDISIAWPGFNLKVAGVRVHYEISEAF